ncbi:hypothetical protein CLOM_g2725 [Closterium sp. NIES-68]|nr:hypothetical protein CLOM_g2725 [Closterium sp. NIES-68]
MLMARRGEHPNQHVSLDPPASDFPAEVLVCALPPEPAHPVPLRSLREFLEYYRLAGAARIVLYDNGAWQEGSVGEEVRGEVERGEVVVVPFQGSRDHELHRHGKTLAQHDCVWGAALSARWVVPAELNEFLFAGAMPAALPAFLHAHASAPFLSLGSLWWASAKCSLDFPAGDQGGDKFTLERMVFRWPWPVCHDTTAFPDANLCLGETGYRKAIVDPRKVEALGAFEARALPDWGEGEDVRTDVAVYNHMQDLFADPSKWCSELFNDDQGPDWWVRDTYLRDYGQSLRANHVCHFNNGQCKQLS